MTREVYRPTVPEWIMLCLVSALIFVGLPNPRDQSAFFTPRPNPNLPPFTVQNTTPTGPAPTTGTLATPVYVTYTVSNPAAFKTLWLPLPANSIVCWGGLVIFPNEDYQIKNSQFQVNKDPLSVGDRITVITFQ